MGVSSNLYEKYLRVKSNFDASHKSVIELGDQEIIFGNLKGTKLRDLEGKFFKNWVSLDLHNVSGITLKDLSVSDPSYIKCDIITNFGTSEHVEPELGHYNCWLNIHNWLSVGGLAIHEIPEVGSWKDHCRYYYDLDFFLKFKDIGYEILNLDQVEYPGNGNLIYCEMVKIKECDFLSYECFSNIFHTNKETSYLEIDSRNNPKGLKF